MALIVRSLGVYGDLCMCGDFCALLKPSFGVISLAGFLSSVAPTFQHVMSYQTYPTSLMHETRRGDVMHEVIKQAPIGTAALLERPITYGCLTLGLRLTQPDMLS